jgi:hypothetical protein
LAYFCSGVAWYYIFFCHQGFFCYREDFNGTVARDLFFCELTPYESLSHTLQDIFKFGFKTQYPKFRVWIRNLYGVDSWKKIGSQKFLVTVPLTQVFGFQ